MKTKLFLAMLFIASSLSVGTQLAQANEDEMNPKLEDEDTKEHHEDSGDHGSGEHRGEKHGKEGKHHKDKEGGHHKGKHGKHHDKGTQGDAAKSN